MKTMGKGMQIIDVVDPPLPHKGAHEEGIRKVWVNKKGVQCVVCPL